ncbi:MAG TPA: T9SS type A sorting domain-containing protein [Bacteroidia bacterium]|nr:T9SS type A sorting domain-containing protein [Bacteroidia bacterium]
MKKNIYAIILLTIGAFFTVKAQSIQIIDTSGTPSIAQASYTISVDADSSNARLFWVKNVTSSPINIQLKSYVVSNLGGDLISYCIGTQCHSAGQPATANTPIPANGTLTNDGLLLDFTDFVGSGYSQVLYTLFNPAHPTTDSVSIMITYKITNIAGIKLNTPSYNISNISPNPASNNVSLNYDLKNTLQPASVKIYNMLGTLVKTASLETYSSNTKIDITSLEEGMYFYSVVVGGKTVKTSRLVVSR